MPQDDSKQWEHLLSQENDPSWSDFELLNPHSTSLRSRRNLDATSCCQKRQLGPRKLTITRKWTILGSNPIYWSRATHLDAFLSTEMILKKKYSAVNNPAL